jgi:hypothetical protein
MHPDRTAPTPDATLTPAPAPPLGTVHGLGLTDALRVELEPSQIPGLKAALGELRGPLIETYESARAEWLAVSRGGECEHYRAIAEAEAALAGAAYALRVLAAIRDQVPERGIAAAFVITGPSGMFAEVVRGATRNAVRELGTVLDALGARGEPGRHALPELADAVRAWVRTYADFDAVHWYRFDPNWDPIHDA